MGDYEKYIGKKMMIQKKNGNVDIGEIIDYDHGFDDDTEETFLMNTINGEPHTYQEIKIADIVNMKEV